MEKKESGCEVGEGSKGEGKKSRKTSLVQPVPKRIKTQGKVGKQKEGICISPCIIEQLKEKR